MATPLMVNGLIALLGRILGERSSSTGANVLLLSTFAALVSLYQGGHTKFVTDLLDRISATGSLLLTMCRI